MRSKIKLVIDEYDDKVIASLIDKANGEIIEEHDCISIASALMWGAMRTWHCINGQAPR